MQISNIVSQAELAQLENVHVHYQNVNPSVHYQNQNPPVHYQNPNPHVHYQNLNPPIHYQNVNVNNPQSGIYNTQPNGVPNTNITQSQNVDESNSNTQYLNKTNENISHPNGNSITYAIL